MTARLSPGIIKGVQFKKTMNITEEQLAEITEVIEDTLEYACDKEQLSGEFVWTVLQCLSTAKLFELNGALTEA